MKMMFYVTSLCVLLSYFVIFFLLLNTVFPYSYTYNFFQYLICLTSSTRFLLYLNSHTIHLTIYFRHTYVTLSSHLSSSPTDINLTWLRYKHPHTLYTFQTRTDLLFTIFLRPHSALLHSSTLTPVAFYLRTRLTCLKGDPPPASRWLYRRR